MSYFINFAAEAAVKPELGREFSQVLQHATPERLCQWFKEHCFNVNLAECVKLVSQKDAVLQSEGDAWGPFSY